MISRLNTLLAGFHIGQIGVGQGVVGYLESVTAPCSHDAFAGKTEACSNQAMFFRKSEYECCKWADSGFSRNRINLPAQ